MVWPPLQNVFYGELLYHLGNCLYGLGIFGVYYFVESTFIQFKKKVIITTIENAVQ